MVIFAGTCCQRDPLTQRGQTNTVKQRYGRDTLTCPQPSFLLNPASQRHQKQLDIQGKDEDGEF